MAKVATFLADGQVLFPDWVKGPTPCNTRTFRIVLPRYVGANGKIQHSVRIEKTFTNRPVTKQRRFGRPGYYVMWADMNAERCPVTGYADCTERRCELHHWYAPVGMTEQERATR